MSVQIRQSSLILAGRAYGGFDILGIFGIIYLTREPEGERVSPDPAKFNSCYKNSRS